MSETVILQWRLYWNTEQRLAAWQAVVELLHVVPTKVVMCVARCKIDIWLSAVTYPFVLLLVRTSNEIWLDHSKGGMW